MQEPTQTSLDWLHPAVDQCRDLLSRRARVRQWTKASVHDGRDEIVTELDLAVEGLLVDAIHDRLPQAAILSEESYPDPSALDADICFVIDPIDGTNELAAGRDGFAICIALFRRGEPVAALLDMPAYDRRFDGAIGAGVRLNGRPVILSKVENLERARLAVSATQLRTESLQPFWDTLTVTALVPTPAFAAKFAAVLANDCDAALYLPVDPHPTVIWDYAAPAFLLAQAGGAFSSLDGIDLVQQRPVIYVGGWLAAPAGLQGQLLDSAASVNGYWS